MSSSKVNMAFFDCDKCSTFAIIGPENIAEKLKQVDEKVAEIQKNWVPSEHVQEFGELTKQLLFIAQGKCFMYVTKTHANLTTYSRKLENYNGTIIFEIDIIDWCNQRT